LKKLVEDAVDGFWEEREQESRNHERHVMKSIHHEQVFLKWFKRKIISNLCQNIGREVTKNIFLKKV